MLMRKSAVLFLAVVVAAAAFGCGGSDDDEEGGGVKTVSLPTSRCFFFDKGKAEECNEYEADVILEPWCQGKPGLCGNWVQTNATDLADVIAPPDSGYISDEAGFQDCQEVDPGKVLVFKLKNGKYAKGILSDITNDENGCVSGATFSYVYPF